MEFKELVKARRSCRAFDSSDIPDDQIAAVLEAGQWAPSPLNMLPWEYIIVKDKRVQAQIIEAAEEAKQAVIDSDGPGWVTKYSMDYMKGAPVFIVVVFDPTKGGLGVFFNNPHGALQAVSACVQNMMLAAADQGLGTLWFTFFDPAKVGALLGVPEKFEVAGVIPIGKPAEEAKVPPRKEPKVHQDRYTV